MKHLKLYTLKIIINFFLIFHFQKYFVDKISWLVHAKHAHMLRWKRFSEHSNVIEDLYVDLKNRLSYILSEYNDSIARAKRLSVAREQLLTNNTCAGAMPFIQKEDTVIYLRWLITNCYSQKSFQQCMKLLEWMPHQMSTDFLAERDKDRNESSSHSIKKSLENLYRINNNSERNSAKYQKASLTSFLNVKFRALDSVYLNSSNALIPREEILNSISYSKL